MRPISVAILFFVIAGLLRPAHAGTDPQGRYSLKAVAAIPIPKAEHFLLWKEVALNMCSEAKTRFNLTEPECRTVISNRADNCASKLSNVSPAVISSTSDSKYVGRKYLYCATPFFFCKGVEVMSEQELRAKC
ncbi:hypothetical protein RCH09_003594 [Actimicrobium sp. GrIS 1.19]|nr:hypothetical protein [Actimicrobium sp. GrIS 1.19]